MTSKPIPEAVLDRLAHEVYQIHCDTPIRAFPNDSHWPKWRAVVQHVADHFTAAQQSGQAVKWRCFHCDEVFTDQESAAEHFGTKLRHDPACTIDPAEFRRLQDRETDYAAEDAAVHRAMARMETEHRLAMEREEIKGYERGLRDSGKCPCAAPQPTQQQGQGAADSEYVGATARFRDCVCQKYEGRDCRKCFRPPYPDQQGQAVAWMRRTATYRSVDGRSEGERIVSEQQVYPDDIPLYTAPPSAPVGVEGRHVDAMRVLLRGYEKDAVSPARIAIRDALRIAITCLTAQQPAAVDEAMAQRFTDALPALYAHDAPPISAVMIGLTAALATQHQEPTT